MTNIVLIVAAHSDDEALGCGGTIARHVAEGDQVHAVFIADGVSSRANPDPKEFERRKAASEKASEILGIISTTYLDFPDNCLDNMAILDIIQPLETVIANLKPQIVYTHHYGDLNVDHQITHRAVMTACRPIPGSTVREILTFEVVSSTEWNSPGYKDFCPNVYIDISDQLETKILALEAYGLEIRAHPHSRCLEHSRSLAHHRGSSVGKIAAEAFMLMRLLR